VGQRLNPALVHEICLHLELNEGLRYIARITKADQKTVRRIRLNLDLFGDLYAPNCVHAKLGRPPSLNKEQEDFILPIFKISQDRILTSYNKLCMMSFMLYRVLERHDWS
jgi:hypothetical protein